MTTAAYHRLSRWTPAWFLAPALAITAAVVVVPAAQTIWLSLQDYLLYEPDAATFVGLGNFKAILQDEVFWISLWHSAIWIIGVVGLQFLLGLVTALLLNQSFWWRGAARALVVVPWALPSVIIGLMWTWMYDFNVGVLNDILVRIGIIDAPVAWLARPDLALAAIMAALVWQGFPFFAITILAGLQTIPAELYEAAEIDGAGEWTKFWTITMNTSKPILAVTALHAFTSAYSAFMMALIIIPDQRMWTLMVWIYQLQTSAHSTVVFASLVIAAIPTFLIFVLCQNIIMRGIVVPQEK